MCKVYIGYHGTSEIEHGLCTCTVDNPLAKARGLSQTMLYLSHISAAPFYFNILSSIYSGSNPTLNIDHHGDFNFSGVYTYWVKLICKSRCHYRR